MKKILLIGGLFLSIYNNVQAAAPAIQWEKSFGGSGFEKASSIQQTTSDGGYIVAGYSNSSDGQIVSGHHGDYDYWVVKVDNAGTIQWQKSLGGTGNDQANAIQQTSDGGYIVAGFSASNDDDVTGNHGTYDYWVVKLDNTGAIQWQKSLGGTDDDFATAVQQTADHLGYIIAGYSRSTNGDITSNHGTFDYWVVKIDNTGAIVWQKSLGGSGNDEASSIQQTSDGGYIVAGYSQSSNGDVTGMNGGFDYWVVKLNSSGAIDWQKNLGGSGFDGAYAIQQTVDGGYIVTGYTQSTNFDVTNYHGQQDIWVVKLNSSGVIQWQKTLGGFFSEDGNAIQQTSDGGYVIAGYSAVVDGDVTSNQGSADYWIIKLSSVGTIEWQKSIGGGGSDVAFSIKQTSDAGYIVAGYSNSTNGDVTGNHGDYDYWVVKLGPVSNCVNGILTVPAISSLPSVCMGSQITATNSLSGGVWSSLNNRATVNSSGVVTGASSGTAIIKYTVSTIACTGSVTKNIAVNSLPYMPSIVYAPGTPNPQSCLGGGFRKNNTFTAVGIPSPGIWSSTGAITVGLNSGIINTGATNGAASLVYTYTDINGCSNSRTISGFVGACRGVNTPATNTVFTIYPNPAKSFINLSVTTLIGAGSIVITDLYGKEIKKQVLSLGNNTIDIANLAKGFYMVSVITNEGKNSKKLIVE